MKIQTDLTCDIFSKEYPFLNKQIIENGDFLDSRTGKTLEFLDFKTKLTNPKYRCVGNNSRDINVFFLIAEALWIYRGRKDVEFLKIFNTKMKDFSDDGKYFNAPYGFRMRHFGVNSFENENVALTEKNQHYFNQIFQGEDQVYENLKLLKNDPNTRRAVMQIWNSEFDLAKNSKDIPCNDIVFLKIRNGKLKTKIANRSNDLHWGLPTNIFQFSFVTEIMAKIIDTDLGTQTHDSDSLHVYTDNPITFKMYDNFQINNGNFVDLYDNAIPFEMNFNFKNESIEGRMKELDYHIDKIVNSCRSMFWLKEKEKEELNDFAPMFLIFYELLKIYVEYKFNSNRSEKDKVNSLKEVINLSDDYPNYDILSLAQNFFYSKIKDGVSKNPLLHRMITPNIL